MGNFGTKLKKYINENNLKVYDLAKKVNIDRTLLQHVFTGKRTLKPEQFVKLVNEDYFSTNEIKDLRELYIRENQTTEDTENKIQFIFDELKKSKPDRPDTHPIDIEKTKKVSSKDDILSIINSLLEASARKRVYTNLPLTENGVGEVLYYALSEKSVEDFKALIYRDIGISCNNLKSIFIAMELARLGCFVRESSIETIADNQMVPYFLIVDDAMLLFNKEISSAVLTSDKNLIDLYSEEFSAVYEKATERIFVTEDIFNLKNSISSANNEEKGQRNNSIETQLCGLFHYDFDELYSSANKEYPNVKELIKVFVNYSNHLAKSFNINIPISAIYEFAETGRIWSIPESYLGRFSIEVRISLLKKMLSEIKEGETNYNFIKPEKFSINRKFLFNEFSDFLLLSLPNSFHGDTYYKTDDSQIRADFSEFIKHMQLNGYYLTSSSVIECFESLIILYGGEID